MLLMLIAMESFETQETRHSTVHLQYMYKGDQNKNKSHNSQIKYIKIDLSEVKNNILIKCYF